MKFFQKRSVAAVVMVLAIAAGLMLAQIRRPDAEADSTAVVGSYTYVYDNSHVLTDPTMAYIDAMNTSLFAQTGAQILVVTVDTTGGADIVDYATELGNQYGVGSRERNNGLVIVLALEDETASGLLGDYGVSGGSGLYDYGDELTSLLYANLESDFAAGDYDAGIRKTFDAYINWFSDFYGVTIRENYIPATHYSFTGAEGYHTVGVPTVQMAAVELVGLVVILLVLWLVLDGVRYRRYRRRYLMPGMGIPTVRYTPIFWGRPRRPHRSLSGGSGASRSGGPRRSFGGGSFGGGFGASRSRFGGGSFGGGFHASRSGGSRSSSRSGGSRRSAGGSRSSRSSGRRGGFGGRR